jgi:HK97 family phage prohead protease
MRTLSFPLSMKLMGAGVAAGTFVGLASVYNVKDLQGDIVMPGAFTKTIKERPVVKLLYQHDTQDPIGLGEISDSRAGLVIKARLALGVERGRNTHELLKAGVLDSLSIGYEVIKSRPMKDGTRELLEIRLWEVSVVTFPANPAAVIADVKHTSDPVEMFRRQLAGMSAYAAAVSEGREAVAFRRLLSDMRRIGR